MSKLVECRLEYALINDASLSASPPTYPPVMDAYQAGYVATPAESYGMVPVTSAGAAVTLYSVPVGATLTIVCDQSNATLCGVAVGGTVFAIGPQGIVTVPGVLVTATPVLSAYSTALAALTTSPFTAQVLWAL